MNIIKMKKIGLITNWYPTKDNPQAGLFFKEQANVMEDIFAFDVIHYYEVRRVPILIYPFLCLFGKNIKISKPVEEINVKEYSIKIYTPLLSVVTNLIYDFYRREIKGNIVFGVGKYTTSLSKKRKKKVLSKISKKYFSDIDAFYCVDAQEDADTVRCMAEALKVPYVVSEHGPFPWVGKVINDSNHEAIEKADLLLAISNDKIRQILLQNERVKNIKYIGNLVDENKLYLKTEEIDVKTFIIVAAHSFYKNYDMFISVMNRLKEIAVKPFRVMIVGYNSNKGYSQDVEEFEKQVNTSLFREYAEMIPSVPHSEIGDVLRKADAFVMTSIQEGQPVSAMEAGCCGLPIFSTRCGGVEDYVDEKVGRIFGITDVESFAESLNDYLEGRITFDREYIRETIVSRFGKDAFRRNFEEAFNSVWKDK